jgi:hypothetical protein
MEKNFRPRLRVIVALLAVIFLGAPACEKRAETAPGVATPSSQSQPSLEIRTDTAPKTIEPATVDRAEGSFAGYIHFPKDSEAAKADSAVQFYCDVSAAGTVTTRYAVVGGSPAFEAAVQSALDWGHFNPAKVDGKPLPVYLGGTVYFFHQNGERVIVVSLATAERERVSRLPNYIQPQLLGGLADRLNHANSTLLDAPPSGAAEVLFKISERGEFQSSSVLSEIPKESGLGALVQNMTKDAHWTPAYNNTKPTAGQINVVVNFSEN